MSEDIQDVLLEFSHAVLTAKRTGDPEEAKRLYDQIDAAMEPDDPRRTPLAYLMKYATGGTDEARAASKE